MTSIDMKTVIIGLDAATWRMMTPLLNEGRLPHINALIDEGASGTLRSTIPPMTPLAWTSIATGVNPGKHGIYDFVAQDRNTYRVAPVNYARLTRPALWDVFNAYGRKVGVVNFPLAFPPPKIDSFFIPGLASPVRGIYAHPPELGEYLRSKDYHIYPRFDPKNGSKRYFDKVKDLTEIQCKVTIELMKRWNWELLWVVFQGLDWIQHYLWNTRVDGENAVKAFYCYMDSVIGRFLEKAQDDWNIVVLSDHGFREIKAEIHLNNILEEWGYLKRVEDQADIANALIKVGLKVSKRLPISHRLKKRAKQQISEIAYEALLDLKKQEYYRLHKQVNWKQTRAFSFGYMGCVYIHKKGKYRQGTVESGDEYEKLREEIITRLKNLKDPGTGEPVVGDIFRKEEIYAGDQREGAPDIVFNPFDFAYMIYGDFGNAWFHRPQGRIADHDMEGIIVMTGKDARRGIAMNAEAVDIAPTLLYLHDLPVLEDMDGQVLREALAEGLTRRQKVQTVKAIASRDDIEHQQSEEEQQEIEEQLRDLGYLR